MPRLSRLRFVSVGHPNARFDDLVLDFRDGDGRATDSTLWLRNGGGKSSILNLFFAGVRPSRREFLGTKSDTKRDLREYVQSEDRAVVVYEWELDGKPGQLEFDGRPDCFVTGTFYEWRGTDLKRLYFACRAAADEPRLTFDGLPLYRFENGKPVGRFTYSGFKQVWQELQKQHPSRHVFATEVQNEWKAVLDNAGIDPELFVYQIKMNHREGGADDLFRFDSHDDFVDFLLELVLDPTLGDTVRKNIEKHRDDIRRSKNRLRPERDMVEGLISRLSPMKEIAAERGQVRTTAADCQRRLLAITNFVTERVSFHQQVVQEQAEIYDRELETASEAEEQAKRLRRHAATLRLFAANEQLLQAKGDDEANQSRLKRANRQVKIWEAAIPLRNAMRFERIAADHRAAIRQARAEHKPLYDSLSATADRYAAALQARVIDLKQQESDSARQIRTLRQEAADSRARAGECDVEIARQEAEIKRLEAELLEEQKQREQLVNDGVLLKAESGVEGVERLNRLLAEQQQEEEGLTARLRQCRELKDRLASQKQSAELTESSSSRFRRTRSS